MSSFVGYIVGILQSALALLGFVQQHPELPPATQQEATQVAQQAIAQALQAVQSNSDQPPANFVVSPKAGDIWTIGDFHTIHLNQPVPPWSYGSQGSQVDVYLTREDNSVVGYIYTMKGQLESKSKFDWNTKNVLQCLGAGCPGHELPVTPGRYKVRVLTQYPVNAVIAESDVFTIAASKGGVSIPGMSKYTDSELGYSFWYPSAWTIQPSQTMMGNIICCTLKRKLNILDSKEVYAMTLAVFHSDDRSITDSGGAGPFGPVKYYFDVNSHTWMKQCPQGCVNDGSTAAVAADTSRNTMGGLHMFAGTSRYHTTIIPLSARDFVLTTDSGMALDGANNLAMTIVALDPAVATPAGIAEQIATIEAEKSAYAGQ